MLWIYASDGKSRVYIGLCDRRCICWLWEDDSGQPKAQRLEHWSVLDLETDRVGPLVSN
jgi:hypothetical protein